MTNNSVETVLHDLCYDKILTFQKVPCNIYHNDRTRITLGVGEVEIGYWLKASKHFIIKAMQTVGDAVLYSRLQQITSFMDYLKRNVPEFQCSAYYISDITPRIAYNNFPAKPQLNRYEAERESLSRELGPVEREEKMLRHFYLLKDVGTHDQVVKQLELTLAGRQQLRDRLGKLDGELHGAASILNEWVEKGHALALLWTVSTAIRICNKDDLEKSVSDVEAELKRIEDFSVKSRAHQQGLWIEDLPDPFYCFFAESVGLFHPVLAGSYQAVPFLGDFAASLEEAMNARLTVPIQRTGFTDQPSTAVAEGLAAFLRLASRVDILPKQTRRIHREVNRPVYFGLRGTRSDSAKILVDEPYLVDLNDLTRHVLISGSTGVGKTRVAQIIAESSAFNVPTVIIDLLGDFTGMIQENPQASKERQFKLPKGRSYAPVIYTLDEAGIKFGTNLLRKPNISEEFIIPCADDVATILSDLMGDLRFRDTFREIIANAWRKEQLLTYDTFLEMTRAAAREKRTSIKLDRLAQFRILISEGSFSLQEILSDKLSIFDLSSSTYTETQKQIVVWYILRELLTYFLGQAHSDDLRCLLIVDECHRFYAEGVPRSAAAVLENTVKQGRSKGLGVVMLTQTIRDLPEVLTQANIRIMLRILEGEIQAYGAKFGMDLARTLHTLEPRYAYVFDSGEQLYCQFRPTLSLPRGIENFDMIREYSESRVALEKFKTQITPSQASPIKNLSKRELVQPNMGIDTRLTEDEDLLLEKLKELGGSARSKRVLQLKLGVGRQKIIDLIQRLELKGILETRRIQNRASVRLRNPKSGSTEI